MLGLRRRVPGFWTSLNQVWREGGGRLSEWMTSDWHVEDEWIVEWVHATLEFWIADPHGPNANLSPEHPWFSIPAVEGTGIPDFKPVFDRPYIECTRWDDLDRWELSGSNRERTELAKECTKESLDEFRLRMTRQFEAQLTEYIRTYRSAYGYQVTGVTQDHADWTALAWVGLPYAEIAQSDLKDKPHAEPEAAVRMAVIRFAEKIGLTLHPIRQR